MARRPFSFPVRSEGGPVLGGSGTELRIYDDEALTTLSTIYAAASGATTIPNPRIPNAGRQTALLANRLSTDTFVTVVDITGFNVGDLIPIYNGTTTAYRVITVITSGTKRFDLDAALGTAFLASNTVVGNLDMKGHVFGWLDDVRDYFMQSKNVASTRVLPPVGIPVRVPTTTVTVLEEGAGGGTRGTINFVSPFVTATDDAGNSRVNVTGPTAGVAPTTSAVGDAAAEGSNTTIARSDHRHGRESFATPAIVHGTAAAAGAAATPIRSDATIVTFDTTAPVTEAVGDAAAVGTATVAARRDHRHGREAFGSPVAGGYANANGSATTLPRSDHVHAVALTTAEAALSADVSIATAGTYVDGPSVSLAAGTWFIVAALTVFCSAGTDAESAAVAKLWDGTTVEASAQSEALNHGSSWHNLVMAGIIVLGSTTTIKASATVTTTAFGAGTILASTPDYGSGNNASHIRAVRIA